MLEPQSARSTGLEPEGPPAVSVVNAMDAPLAVPQAHAIDHAATRRSRTRRGWLVRRLLAAADVVGLSLAFALTQVLHPDAPFSDGIGPGLEAAVFVLALPLWIVAAKLYGLYDRDEERATHSTVDELVNVFHLITVGAWSFYAISWIFGLASPDQRKLATFWLLAILGVIGARLAARSLARRHPSYAQNALVVGAGDVGQLIGRKLQQHPEYRINLVGYVDTAPKSFRDDLAGVEHLGELQDIEEIVRLRDVDRVVVAFSLDRHEEMLHVIAALRKLDVQIDVVPRLYEALSPRTAIHDIEGLPLLGLATSRIPRASRLLKRGVDILGASVLLALTLPLMLVVALLVRWDSPGPVLFRQVRLGMNMRRFTMLKFRTMRDGTDDTPHRAYVGQIMTSDATPSSNNLYKLERPEVTRFGRWLRRTSIDELPQLFNVLRGDMSLVGPRPSIPYELELYLPHHFERFDLPAGLTGFWQVEARAHTTFREALDLDVAYVRGWSFGLDLRLILQTPALMLRKQETG